MPSERNKFILIPFLTAGLYLLLVALFSSNQADYDLWGYLAFGRIFWEDGCFPFHDVFSYLPTKTIWVYHEWLTGVFFYFIYKYSGAAGLQLFRYIVVVLTLYLIYLTAEKRGAKPIWRLIALIPAALLISFGYVPVRAQIFTYLFFILTLYLLESTRKGQKWSLLWWLLPIQVLWCNFHGGFLAGLGLIGLYGLGERLSGRKALPFFKIGAMAVLLTLLNPYGIQYWAYTLQAVFMPRTDIAEWVSVFGAFKKGIYGVPVYIFIVMSLLGAFLYVFRHRKDYTDLLVVAVTIFLGWQHVRHNIFFGLVFGSYLPILLTEYWTVWKGKKIFFTLWGWFPQTVMGVLLFSVYWLVNPSLAVPVSPSFVLITPSPQFPAGAYKWIKMNRFQGNILPHFEWGEFLIWYFYPACRIAMDGRYETVYEDQVSREYFLFLSGKENGRDFLRKYPHDMVLIKPNSGADFLMRAEPAWKKVYSDSGCVVYLREKRLNSGQEK
ncbi:MAG: hypothetical protein V2B13_02615 [Pseudomonadota bacterium]